MEKEIYSANEKNLVEGAKWLQSLQKLNKALELDLILLKLESSVGLMDGMPIVKEAQ